jgi:predicted nucleic-acid-binding Zn-ribbon protein
MKELSEEQRRKIVETLDEKGANLPCPRCGNDNFALIDGYFNQIVQTELKGMVMEGPSLPSAIVVCNRCGYLNQHALGPLGLLPSEEI